MEIVRHRSAYAGVLVPAPDPDVPELLFAGEAWVPATYVSGPICNDFLGLYLQLNGSTTWEIGGVKYNVGTSTFLAVPPLVPHQMTEPPPSRHHFAFAGIDLDTLLTRSAVLAEIWPHQLMVVQDAQAMAAPFRNLLRETSPHLPLRSIGLRFALDTLLLEAVRVTNAKDSSTDVRQIGSAEVFAAKRLVDENPGYPWTLANLASAVGMSQNDLSRKFADVVGMPPRAYVLDSRIEAAKRRLADDVSIAVIALDLGFASSQHFATAFKRIAGCTPTEFRAGSYGDG